ncbi:MAG: hypothetical protein HY286_19830 [Planctomycetes bacterium]|nr:hypothetical protein [Planctomycetota bacterium]
MSCVSFARHSVVPALAAAFLWFPAAGPAAAVRNGPQAASSQWPRLVLNPPGLSSGDYDKAVHALLDEVVKNPTADASEILLNRAFGLIDRVADKNAVLKRTNDLLHGAAPTGRLELRLRLLEMDSITRSGDWARLSGGEEFFPGLLAHAAVIGPFGDGVQSAIQVPFAPERGLAFDQTAASILSETPLRWQALARRKFQPNFDIEISTIRDIGVLYFKSQVRFKSDADAFISIFNNVSHAVWWNGAKIFSYDADTAQKEPLVPIPVHISAGWNQLLVKTDARGANLIMRFVDADGRTLKDFDEEINLTEHALAPNPAPAPAMKPFRRAEDRVADLISRANDADLAAELRAVRGSIRINNEKSSEGLADLRAAAAALPTRADIQFALAEATVAAAYLPPTESKNRARESLDLTIKLDPAHVPALLMRADLQARDDRMEDALQTLNEAEKANPNSYLIPRARALVFGRLQWPSERRKAVEKAAVLAPKRADLQLDLAREANGAAETELYISCLERGHEQDASNAAILSALMSHWIHNGQATRVVAEQERALELYQSDDYRESLARTLEMTGARDRAIGIRKEIRERRKNDKSAFENLIASLRLAKRDDEAEKFLAEEFNKKPSDGYVRNWYREVGGGLEDEAFFNKYRANCMDAIKNYKPTKEFEKAPDALIVDQQIEHVFQDGSTETEITSVVRVNDQEGIRMHGSAEFRGDLLELKVVHSDGTYDEPTPAKNDFALPNLKPGDFILTRSRAFHEAGPGERPQLGQFNFQSTERPFAFSQYVLSLPKNNALRLVERHYDGEHQVAEGDAEITHIFTKTNSPRVLPEYSAPDPNQYLPWVKAGVSRTIEDLYRAFRASQLRSMDVTEEIRAAAADAVAAANAKSDREKAAALYKFTNDLLVERAGNNAVRSLLEKRGNPIALYGALLKATDVPFDLVAIRGFMEGTDDEVEPDFLDFNRYQGILFRVRPRESAEPIWVDMTAKYQPFGARLFQSSGAEALILGESGPERIQMPGLPMEEAMQAEIESTAELKGGQAAYVKVKITFRNSFSWILRERFKNLTADIKKAQISGISNRFVEGIELEKYDFDGLEDATKPFGLHFEGTVSNFLRQGAATFESPLVLAQEAPAKEFSGKSKRKLPIRLGNLRYQREKLTIKLADAQSFGETPQNIVKDAFTTHYELKLQKSDREIVVERIFVRKPGTIPAQEFTQFLTFHREIEEAEQLKLPILEK